MYINLGKSEGHLHSIELRELKNHYALPHLNQFVSRKKPEYYETINKIHIRNSSLDDKDYYALQHIINHCSGLCEVELSSNHIDTKHAHDLLCSLPLSHLEKLSFTDNWIGEKIPDDYFVQMRDQRNMKYLDFSLNWLRDKGITRFLESINSSLEQLNLSCNDFGSKGMEAIANFIINNPLLSELDVSYNHLDVNSAEFIALILKESTSFLSIKANSNLLGDGGATIIADAIGENSSNTLLDLSDNNISTAGAKYLIDNLFISGVKRGLVLNNNPLNRQEINKLVQLKKKKFPQIDVIF